MAGTAVVDGRLLIAIDVAYGDYWIRDVFFLGDDDPVAVLRQKSTCLAYLAPDSPGILAYVADGNPSEAGALWLGELGSTAPAWLSWEPPETLLQGYLVDGSGFVGGIVSNAEPFVRVPAEGSIQPLAVGTSLALRPRGRGESFVWNEWSGGRGRLRRWTVQGGLEAAFTPPDGFDVTRVALSDTYLAWIEAQGTDTLSGFWSTAHIAWAPRNASIESGRTISQVSLPVTQYSTGDLRSHGSYAATAIECPSTPEVTCGMVLDLADDQGFSIPPPAGYRIGNVIAAGETQVVYPASVVGDASEQIQRLLVIHPESGPDLGTPID